MTFRAIVGAELEDFAGAFDGIVNLKRFREVAGHRFLDIDVLPGIESIDSDLGVPVVNSSDVNGVNIVPFEEVTVILVAIGFAETEVVGGAIDPGFPDVADGDSFDVPFGGVAGQSSNVGAETLTSNADKTDADAIVGSGGGGSGGGGDWFGRRGWGGPSTVFKKNGAGGEGCGGKSAFFDEFAARSAGGLRLRSGHGCGRFSKRMWGGISPSGETLRRWDECGEEIGTGK